MKNKTLILMWLLYIFTFGIAYFVLKKKAIEKVNTTNDNLTVTNKLLIDINEFIKSLGGIDNIKETNATINSINVFIHDNKKIDLDNIKKLGAKGTMVLEKKITCLFGDFSMELSKQLNEILKNKKTD